MLSEYPVARYSRIIISFIHQVLVEKQQKHIKKETI